MSTRPAQYDCFISYPSKLQRRAEDAEKRMKDAGLKPYVAHRKMKVGDPWPREIAEGLAKSEHLLVLWSKEADESEWVRKEVDTFRATKNKGQVLIVSEDDTELPAVFGSTHQPDDLESAVRSLAAITINQLHDKIGDLNSSLEETQSIISKQLDQFLYKKFWKGFFDKSVHIFTCGRDVKDDSSNGRGDGGRTNIDLQDYQTVCDIHSFFARHNPQTHLQIVPPASKVTDIPNDLSRKLNTTLMDKDCIIIGSPDVSDYAELVLATLHDIEPWDEQQQKWCGFVIRKPKGSLKTPSVIYRDAGSKDEEGVALLKEGEIEKSFPVKRPVGTEPGITYGILTIARNPCEPEPESSVMILSGFTGIATNAMVQFLTNEDYATRLHSLDQQLDQAPDRGQAVEVLLRVQYSLGDAWADRDDRNINSVEVVELDFIQPRRPAPPPMPAQV